MSKTFEEFEDWLRNALITLEADHGPFAFVALKKQDEPSQAYVVVLSSKGVDKLEKDQNPAQVIGDFLYARMDQQLRVYFGGLRTIATDSSTIPDFVRSTRESPLDSESSRLENFFSVAPRLEANNTFTLNKFMKGETHVLVYDETIFKSLL